MSGSAKFQAYLATCAAAAAFFYFGQGYKLNNSAQWVLVGISGGALYLVFGNILARMFQNHMNSKANQAYETQQRNEQERQRNQRLEDKRQELAIEFDHLQKIMFLQANLDQGKLDKLQSMQTALKSAKNDDLDTLRRQIETMKRG
jgi:hypothetical protein